MNSSETAFQLVREACIRYRIWPRKPRNIKKHIVLNIQGV